MTVNFLHFEVSVKQTSTIELGASRMKWATENVGMMARDWTCAPRLTDGRMAYYFKREQDAMLFALKWGDT